MPPREQEEKKHSEAIRAVYPGAARSLCREAMNHEDAFRTNAVVRYLFHEMNLTEMEEYEAHFFNCNICAREVMVCSKLLMEFRGVIASTRTPAQQFRRCRELITKYAGG